MKYYNVCTKVSFEKNGEVINKWPNVGTLKELDDGRKFLDLNMFPTTTFYVFEQKEKEETTY